MLPMNLNTLNEFRHAVSGCFKQAGDALFNTIDALSSETAAHSFPELSLSPFFQRRWPRLYEAFEDGKIDAVQTGQRTGAIAQHQSCRPQTLHTGWANVDGKKARATTRESCGLPFHCSARLSC